MPPIRDLILLILNHHECGMLVSKPRHQNRLTVHQIHALLVDYFYPNGVINGKRAVMKYLNKLTREAKVQIDWTTHYSAKVACTNFTYEQYLAIYEPHLLIIDYRYRIGQWFNLRNILDILLVSITTGLIWFVWTHQELFRGTGL